MKSLPVRSREFSLPIIFRLNAKGVCASVASRKDQPAVQAAQVGNEGKVLKKRRVTKSREKKNKRGFTCEFLSKMTIH